MNAAFEALVAYLFVDRIYRGEVIQADFLIFYYKYNGL